MLQDTIKYRLLEFEIRISLCNLYQKVWNIFCFCFKFLFSVKIIYAPKVDGLCRPRRRRRSALALRRCILPILQINRPLALNAWHLWVPSVRAHVHWYFCLAFNTDTVSISTRWSQLGGVPVKITIITVIMTLIHNRGVYLIETLFIPVQFDSIKKSTSSLIKHVCYKQQRNPIHELGKSQRKLKCMFHLFLQRI